MTLQAPADSQDGARRRDDAVPDAEGSIEGRQFGAVVEAFEARDAMARSNLTARIARLEAERDEARANAAADRMTLRSSLLEELDVATDQRAAEAYRADRAEAERNAMRSVVEAVRALHKPTLQTVEWFHDQTGKGEALCCPSCRPEEPSEWDPPIGWAGVEPEGFVPSYTVSPCPTLAAVDQTAPSCPLETSHTSDGGEAGVVEGAGGSEATEGVVVVRDQPSDLERQEMDDTRRWFMVVRPGSQPFEVGDQVDVYEVPVPEPTGRDIRAALVQYSEDTNG